MKRFLTTLFFVAALCFAAAAQEIRDIDETVVLRADGSARITQVWDATVVSGTEFYLPFDHLGPLDIHDLAVSEGDLAFVSEGDRWDVDRSLEQKRGRCGIVRKNHGVELCWGQGSLGDHVWTVSYTVDGLVMKMGEYNGLYFSFVNPGLSAPPQHVKVTLVNETGGPAWTPDNVKVWGFRSPSEIFVEDGTIRAESTEAFSYNSAMTVLARFDADLFTPAVDYKKDFQKVQDLAFRGSDYKDKVTLEDIFTWILLIGGLLIFTPVGWVLLGVLYLLIHAFTYHVLGWKYEKKFFGARRIKGWYRDVPLEGSIPAAYYVLSNGDRMNNLGKDISKNLIGAYFLRWVLDGLVEVLPDPGKKSRVNLSFEKDEEFTEPVESALYAMVREASGSNLILEAGELEKWSKKSFSRISNLPERTKTLGLKWFQDNRYYAKNNHLTKEGQEQARHLIEFKNYLEDFTLSRERGAIEVTLWKDFLVLAALFGIADKVAREFEKLYPVQFTQFTQSAGFTNATTLFNTLHMSNDISASAMRQALAEKAMQQMRSSGSSSGGSSSSGSYRSSGGGGHFSSHGGGHSFGGSRGGGSR